MPQNSMFSSMPNRKVVVAAACTLPADSLFAVLLYLVYPDSFLPSTLFIANFSLVLLALIGINSRISSMILPALVWKCILLLFLLFLGCISVDAYQQIPVENNETNRLEIHSSRSIAIWKELAMRYPLLPLIAVICTIVLALEARIFFTAWQKICCPLVNSEEDLEKAPPSYVSCVRETASEKDLPSYEDALRRVAATSSSSTIIYTLPDAQTDLKKHPPQNPVIVV
ncbi:unnamed protein product [Caenorhabditis bovis]|uniref:Uncharacterized protein n=1 Tax=Caenorhabditis bovis TaxID=2654633 RepID=A0A8S1ET31_9PELO|nr:unnamed protein product [Caenorhabditis bovis]